MHEVLKLGLRLFLITVVAAVCLAGTNRVTKGSILAAETAAATASRKQVLSQADTFEKLDVEALISQNPDLYKDLDEAYRGVKDGQTMGYTFALSPNGYKAALPITVGIDTAGVIVDIAIGDIQETAGLGTRIKEAPFITQFAGKPAQSDVLAEQVQTLSGATISSRACLHAVQQAAAFYQNALGGKEGQP
ncbi:MAG: FMN-binding protein [Clostridia bacterium]